MAKASPTDMVRKVADKTGIAMDRSKRGVPYVAKGRRSVAYFGNSLAYALFQDGERQTLVHSADDAATWLLGDTVKV